MTDRVDLVVERLVLEGLDLIPEQAATLARLVEAEVRRIVDGGQFTASRTADAVAPVTLSEPQHLPALARVLAQRIADEALSAVVGHG